MAENSRRRNTFIALAVILLLILLLLLRCRCVEPEAPEPAPAAAEPGVKPTGAPAAAEPDEVLTPATVTAPERVIAGVAFSVTWTGPDNRGDYVTVVRGEASASEHGSYQETRKGPSLELTAP